MQHKVVSAVVQYGVPVILPVVAAVSSAVAAVNVGPVRVYWTLGAIASTASIALLGTIKEVRSQRARLAAKSMVDKVKITIADCGQPLIAALGNVAVADEGKREAAVQVLIDRAIATARAQCGHGTRASYRCAFYEVDGDGLRRVAYEGRRGEPAPRPEFRPGDGDFARYVIAAANDEACLLVEDLHASRPAECFPKNRTYRTLISVPVNANGHRFGLLSVDSPEPDTLTIVDRGYMILIAGVLAAGLAQLPAGSSVADLDARQ